MNERFSGKTIIITGASAGVGAACARAFATQKANLVLVARGQQGLDIIEEELSAQTKVLTVAMDVSNVEQCLALLVKAEEEFGTVDVLVNNAGMHSRGDLETVDPADVGAMVDINIRAPLVLSRHGSPTGRGNLFWY
jgi:NADP-dependent 3-hydroxy acid dehydrogenase YdfG